MKMIEQETMATLIKAMIFHSSEPYITSTQIAKYFGIRHDNLLTKIRDFDRFDELVSFLKIKERKRVVNGREYPYFELDADAYAFTCLSINGKKAEDFKWAILQALKSATIEAIRHKTMAETNRLNEDWSKNRLKSKDTRALFVDKVKEFCEYAQAQRGYKYDKCPYFIKLTSLVYKSLGLKPPRSHQPRRDIFTSQELEDIENLESRLIELIDDLMADEVEYHRAYKMIKAML
jgi:phage regulator Rha-like protein